MYAGKAPSLLAVCLAATAGALLGSVLQSRQNEVVPLASRKQPSQASAPPPQAAVLYPTYLQPQPASAYLPSSQDKPSLWSYKPALDGRSIERGILQRGDPTRLRWFAHKLVHGEPVHVVALGASVTRGSGSCEVQATDTKWPGYVTQFEMWLNATFPHSRVKVTNAAVPATGIEVMSACVDSMAPQDADMVIVEAASSPARSQQFADNPIPSVERMIRRLLRYPNQPLLLLMQYYSHEILKGLYYTSMENDLNTLASYYSPTVLSVRSFAYRHLLDGRYGFKLGHRDDSLGNSSETEMFYYDQVHPYGPTGHRYMADLLIATTQMAVDGLLAAPLTDWEMEYLREPLPQPLLAGNYEQPTSQCNLNQAFEGVVVDRKGFDWVNEKPEATDPKLQKWGYVSQTVGSWAELLIDTRLTASAKVAPSSDKANVLLAHLKSYTNMGRAKVECRSGCTCQPSVLDGHWDKKASMQMLHTFAATQHPECRIRVTVLQESSSGSGGNSIAGGGGDGGGSKAGSGSSGGGGGGHKVKLSGIMLLPGSSAAYNEKFQNFFPVQFELITEKTAG